MTDSDDETLTLREARRRQTRQRVYAAAVAEFKAAGMAGADVGAIAAAAGVAKSTFFFHFPTKGHVLAELEHREEARLAGRLTRFLDAPHDLEGALTEVARLVAGIERRLGTALFRDLLALHFSPARPDEVPGADSWERFPLMVLLVTEVEAAKKRGEVNRGSDALHTAQFFLLGLYAILITATSASRPARARLLDSFVTTVLRGVVPRLAASRSSGKDTPCCTTSGTWPSPGPT